MRIQSSATAARTSVDQESETAERMTETDSTFLASLLPSSQLKLAQEEFFTKQ